jgi:hypothetical protein
MRNRIVQVTSGAVAAVLALSALSSASARQPSATEVVLKLIAKRESAMNLGAIPTTILTFVVAGPLLDAADPGKKLGSGKAVCTFTDFSPLELKASADCRSVYTIDGKGEIHMSSSRVYALDVSGIHYNETKLAVTGGTGAYRTARGDASGTFRKTEQGVSYAVDIRLTLDTPVGTPS